MTRSTAIACVSAAALFISTAFVGAQAPPAPQQEPPAAPRPAAAGPRQGGPGTESGWATFQGQCYRCHGNTAVNGGPTAARSGR